MYLLKGVSSTINRRISNFYFKNRIDYWTELTKNRLINLPPTDLSQYEKKEISNFYKKYFDIKINPHFHQFYKAATGQFDIRYIPDDLYYSYIDPYYNNWENGVNMDNKVLYRIYFPDVKQPELVCYRHNGIWFDGNGEPLHDADIADMISLSGLCFIKKATASMGGHGISVIDSGTDSESIKNELNKFDDDIIIQKGLQQSKVLSKLNSSSVNTIRIMTFLRKDGSIKICSTSLRMGVAGSRVDNASSGGITIGVSIEGNLNDKAFAPSGQSYSIHPSSRVSFSDIKIPNFEKVIDLVSKLALRFPQFRLISWDIALDESNTSVLIETNLFVGELEFHQLNNGPIFGEETETILSEIASNPKKLKYPF